MSTTGPTPTPPEAAVARTGTARGPDLARRLTKGERTRLRILESAYELFARSGYHAVSIRDIATHAGLTHAGLLKHFPGKDDLLLDVLARREADEAAAQQAQREAGDSFAQILAGTLRRGIEKPAFVALFSKIAGEATAPDHPSHAYFTERYERLRRGLSVAMRAALSEAEPADPPVDPDVAATQLLGLMDGLQIQWLLAPGSVDLVGTVLEWVARLGVPVPGVEVARPVHGDQSADV